MYSLKMTRSASLILATVFLLRPVPVRRQFQEFNADPRVIEIKRLRLSGLSETATGSGQGAYEIDDGTGRLWVVTSVVFLHAAAQSRSEGPYLYRVQLCGRNYGTVLEETDRASKKSRTKV